MSNSPRRAFDNSAALRAGPWSRVFAPAIGFARRALPQRCALCVANADGALLCAACDAALFRLGSCCPVCALPSSGAAVCGACRRQHPPFAATIAALVYAWPVDRLLHRMKYRGELALADWAGANLATAVRARLDARVESETPDRVVALPLARARQRERGFNQAREIAGRVAHATGLPLAAALERIAGGPPQAALPWNERRRNVRGAFAVRGEVASARIALVDDVMTTGATLAEAAQALRRAGAARVECWVVARTLPPGTA